jgi:hypothetical protein
MSAVITAVQTGIHAALNVAAITDLTGSGKIYAAIAPLGTALPLVIYQQQGGGDENLTPSRMRNVLYTVKAVASSRATAAGIDAQIDTALHNVTLTVGGWTAFWCARETDIEYAEVDDAGDVIYHIGGIYRIRIGA